MVGSMGIIGGSGPLGRGLAGRFAWAGIDVSIGSREQDRAADAAAAAMGELDAATGSTTTGDTAVGRITGALNVDVLDHDIVVVTLPAAALDTTLPELADGLRGRLVVSTVNPLGFDDRGPHPIRLPSGSAASAIAAHLPDARITAAFHTVSSHHLLRFDEPMDDDVPVVGDDEDAVATVVDLVDRVPGMRGVAVGPLRLAAPLEDLTPVLIAMNRRAGSHVGVRFSRLGHGSS